LQDEDTAFLLEAQQGDAISGKVSRGEVAQVVVAAAGSPSAAGAQGFLSWKPHCSNAESLSVCTLDKAQGSCAS